MPSILEGRCESCDATGPRFSGGFRSVSLDNGSKAALPHPGEGVALAELGLTWDEAKSRGALRSYKVGVCSSCVGTSPHSIEANAHAQLAWLERCPAWQRGCLEHARLASALLALGDEDAALDTFEKMERAVTQEQGDPMKAGRPDQIHREMR